MLLNIAATGSTQSKRDAGGSVGDQIDVHITSVYRTRRQKHRVHPYNRYPYRYILPKPTINMDTSNTQFQHSASNSSSSRDTIARNHKGALNHPQTALITKSASNPRAAANVLINNGASIPPPEVMHLEGGQVDGAYAYGKWQSNKHKDNIPAEDKSIPMSISPPPSPETCGEPAEKLVGKLEDRLRAMKIGVTMIFHDGQYCGVS